MVGATCVVAQPPSIRKKGVAPDSLAPPFGPCFRRNDEDRMQESRFADAVSFLVNVR